MAFQGDPLLEHPEALTRIRLSVLRLLDIIKGLPAEEMGELADKFEDFEVAQMAILSRQAELRSLPEGAPFKVPPKARWQPPPKKKHGKANQRGKTSAEIAERAADVAVRELQKERQEEARKQKEQAPSGGVDLSQFLIQNKEPADEVDMDIEEDEQQPFDEPSKRGRTTTRGLITRKYSKVPYWTTLTKILVRRSLLRTIRHLPIIKSRHLSYSINLVERRVPELEGPILD
ncbi:hypothetical protein V2W45_1357437 [Cenococcum geophilum]